MLDTVQALVRGESMWSINLSDYYLIRYHATQEPQEYTMLLSTIYVGKTNGENKGKALSRKSFRHKDPVKCGHGALALYLYARFLCHEEEFDLTNNKQWFNIKCCVAHDQSRTYQNEVPITYQTFYTAMKDAYKDIGENPRHVVHFGRSEGPSLLELEEVEPNFIKLLGNWDLKVFEQHYSARMPFQAMRVAAGFKKEKGSYYLPRATMVPSQSLILKVFPSLTRARSLISASLLTKHVTAKLVCGSSF